MLFNFPSTSTFNTANNQNQKPRVRMHITRNIKVNLSETLNTANSHIVDADQGKSNKKTLILG